mgnify:CR=1 FL=1
MPIPPEMVKFAAETGTDRIELYTEAYAKNYETDKEAAIKPYYETAVEATKYGLGINAGHDLSLDNTQFEVDFGRLYNPLDVIFVKPKNKKMETLGYWYNTQK